MDRKIECWETILYPEAMLAPYQLVGKAKYEDENEKLIVDIIWNNELVLKARSTLIITSTENPEYRPIIYTSDKYIKLLCEKQYADAALWHEIGHIHWGHLDGSVPQEEIRRERYEALISGGVSQLEKEADMFATKFVGKNRMIQFLQFCKTHRRNNDDDNSMLAIKEFDARINYIKRMKL